MDREGSVALSLNRSGCYGGFMVIVGYNVMPLPKRLLQPPAGDMFRRYSSIGPQIQRSDGMVYQKPGLSMPKHF
jgi:hypothetical protein